jgi:hypothetical protein
MLGGLVKHQEQTRIGRIAQRRSKEPAKELRRSTAYDGPQGRRQGTVRMEVTLQEEKIKLHASKDVGRGLRTSYRALSTEKGFNAKPAATRVVAPARRFPGPVSTGSTEEDCLSGSRFWTAEKRGDVAMKPRN